MIEIKNELISVGINIDGAELEYIKIKGINILWEREDLWMEQSPILFPNVGAFKDNCYIYEGKKYHNLVHGFAKRSKFNIVEQTATKLRLRLKDSSETYEIYPFKFCFDIIYEVIDNTINCNFEVVNKGENTMYFALGIHPGYSYFGLNQLLGNYSLGIVSKNYESVDFIKAYASGTHLVKLNKMSFNDLSKMLIIPRTLCYKDLKIIDILGDSCSIRIYNAMPYTAFWQKEPEGNPKFLCIEGWYGLPDSISSAYEIAKKDNLQVLNKNSIFKTYYSITYNNK